MNVRRPRPAASILLAFFIISQQGAQFQIAEGIAPGGAAVATHAEQQARGEFPARQALRLLVEVEGRQLKESEFDQEAEENDLSIVTIAQLQSPENKIRGPFLRV